MNKYTPHELLLIEHMNPHNKALISKLSQEERNSLKKNVNLDNIHLIQSWIGTDKEIENMLFWVKGGKFDDPEWQNLKPVDQTTTSLYEKAMARFEGLKLEAVESQRRSDLTLYSQFNTGLLFTGLAGAVRCSVVGKEDVKGEFFKGVELRCIGSVEENINSITIYPSGSGGFEVHFGNRVKDKDQGIYIYSGDSFSLIQLARLVDKDLPKLGYEIDIRDLAGQKVSLDPKAIRNAARKGEGQRYDRELILHASARVKSLGEAIESAKNLSRCFYERFGIETECYKISKRYRNFYIMRDDNFDQLLPPTPVKERGLVLFTATLVCRRCRREIERFRNFGRLYPDVTFALVNLTSPQSKFYERVFGDMGGGDYKYFRNHAVGATPFTIIYVPDEKGVLQFAEYYGTKKDEAPPSFDKTISLLNRYFK